MKQLALPLNKPKFPEFQRRDDGLLYRYDHRWVNNQNAFGGATENVENTFFSSQVQTSFVELESLFRHNWVCRRIVTDLAEVVTREGFTLDTKENQEVADKLLEDVEELDVNQKLYESIVLARLYGGSLCVLGAYDRLPISEPLDVENVQWFGFLMPLDRYQCWPIRWYSDPSSPKYGQPSHYLIQPLAFATTLHSFVIHETRCLRFDGNYLPIRIRIKNIGWHDSVLEVVYESARQFGISIQAASALMQDYVIKVIKVENLEDLLSTEQDNLILQRLQLTTAQMSVNGMAVIGENEDIKKIGTPVQGLYQLMEQFVNQVCAASKEPKSVLFGNLSGVLGANAAGVDLRNWYDTCRSYQIREMYKAVKDIVALMRIARKRDVKYKIRFNPLWQFDEETRSNIMSKLAQSDATYIQSGVLYPTEVAESRFGGPGINMEQMVLDRELRKKMGLDDPTSIANYQKQLSEMEYSTKFEDLAADATVKNS